MISRTRVSFRLAVMLFLLAVPFCLEVRAKRAVSLPGRRGVVFDERLSALRAQPDLKAPLRQRLRRGRVVGILGAARSSSGTHFFKVAISSQTWGWVLAEAVARAGVAADAERLMDLIEETPDDFAKLKLARLCADEYRATGAAPRALLILGETADAAAARLTREARRRIGEAKGRLFLLSYSGLDRYNRIGVTFDYDEAGERLVYDGKAYREILRRYPRSEEAKFIHRRGAEGAEPAQRGERGR